MFMPGSPHAPSHIGLYLRSVGCTARSPERPRGDRLREQGPRARWSAEQAQFDAVTTGSAAELVEAGRLLAIGAGQLEDVDGYTEAALQGVRDELARGSDAWSPDEV
jgi:hypothetical protein